MVRTYFILGLSGVELKSWEKNLLSHLKPIGVILFSRNFDDSKFWHRWYLKLVESILKEIGSNELILCIDHEGGRVHRFPKLVTHFPPARDYVNYTFEVGKQMGRELRQLGFNLNFAPCVDVLTNLDSIVIGDRAFSSNPDEVIPAATTFLKGLESEGVFGCYKHFPGHGATKLDSHFELPKVNLNFRTLRKIHLKPYYKLPSNLRFIMTAHILYPNLSSEIATMSEFFLKKILREKIGYKGFIVSDDIEMKALESYWVKGEDFIKRLKGSGCDIVLVSNNNWIFRSTFEKIIIDKQINQFVFDAQKLHQFKVSLQKDLDLQVFEDGKRLLEKIKIKSETPAASS